MRVFRALESKQEAVVFHGVSHDFLHVWIILRGFGLPVLRCYRGEQPVIAVGMVLLLFARTDCDG